MLTRLRSYAVTGIINRALRGQTSGDLQAYRHLDRLFSWPFDTTDRAVAAYALVGVMCRDMPRPTGDGVAQLRFFSYDDATGDSDVREPDQVPAHLLCWGRMCAAYLTGDLDTVGALWDGYAGDSVVRGRLLLRLALESAGAAAVGASCTCGGEHDGDGR